MAMYELVLGLAAGTSTMPAKAADDAVMPGASVLRKQVCTGSKSPPNCRRMHSECGRIVAVAQVRRPG